MKTTSTPSLNNVMNAILKTASTETMTVSGDLRTGTDTAGQGIGFFSEMDIRQHQKFGAITSAAKKSKRIISFYTHKSHGNYISLNPLYVVNSEISKQYDRWIQLSMMNGNFKLDKRRDEISFILYDFPLTMQNFLDGNLWQTLFRLASTLHYLYIEVRPENGYLRVILKEWGQTTDLQRSSVLHSLPQKIALKTLSSPEISSPEDGLNSIAFFLHSSDINVYFNIDEQRKKKS